MRRYSNVESLTSSHQVDDFDCGSDAQTVWLRRHALNAHTGETCRVYVVRRLNDDGVVGYHALAAGAVLPENATERILKGVGRYDQVPVVILTRLGVDLSEQGKGLGKALVKDALIRVAHAADAIGARALLIHAEDTQARDFYTALDVGFEESPTDPLHLLLLMKDLRRTLS